MSLSSSLDDSSDDEDTRKPAALDLNLHHNFYAVRKSPNLVAPAIFFSWEDCFKYVNVNDMSTIDFKRFDSPLRAMQYLSDYIVNNGAVPEPTVPPASKAQPLPLITPKAPSVSPHNTMLPLSLAARSEPTAPPASKAPLLPLMTPKAPSASPHNTLLPLSLAARSATLMCVADDKQTKFDKQFKLNLELLRKYKALNGHCNAPARYDPSMPLEFKTLGRWVSSMRCMIRQFQNPLHIASTSNTEGEENADVGTADMDATAADSDRDSIADATATVEAAMEATAVEAGAGTPTGNTTVAPANTANTNPSRLVSKLTPPCLLNNEQMQSLLDVGLQVAVKGRGRRSHNKNAKFNTNTKRLQDYIAHHGHDFVPTRLSDIPTETQRLKLKGLGGWAKKMRKEVRLFKKGDGSESALDAVQVTELERVGLTIEPKKTGRPKGMATHSKKSAKPKKPVELFKDDVSSDPVMHIAAHHCMFDPCFNSSSFLTTQPRWDGHFAELKAFYEKHGHTTVPQKPKNELYNFTFRVRLNYERFKEGSPSSLNGERIIKLAGLNFQFTAVKRKNWNERSVEWLEYFTKYGRSPPRHTEGGIGDWVGKMRRCYRLMNAGQPSPGMTREQADKLTGWGFIWESPMPLPVAKGPRLSWEERFEELLAYKEEHGDCLVPQTYPGLGQWTKRMRREYQAIQRGGKSYLKEEQIDRLFEVDFVFQLRESRPHAERNNEIY